MKEQATTTSVAEVEFGVVTRFPAEEIDVEELAELSPAPEEVTPPKGREIRPLTLVLTMLGLALLILIPSLLLIQRLQS